MKVQQQILLHMGSGLLHVQDSKSFDDILAGHNAHKSASVVHHGDKALAQSALHQFLQGHIDAYRRIEAGADYPAEGLLLLSLDIPAPGGGPPGLRPSSHSAFLD